MTIGDSQQLTMSFLIQSMTVGNDASEIHLKKPRLSTPLSKDTILTSNHAGNDSVNLIRRARCPHSKIIASSTKFYTSLDVEDFK